ncbi:hypothetical protein FDI85_gp253 [Erwinia phage Machina]|uniref:Uncharacterized protein n=2 Tax=Machinavirus machina TaxID=2169990 RepID=A0A1B2ID18_9CAUD|nr:hypothetical protein BIZ81_gp251 [Erwinia phage vB_EamM_Huxley]YP_009616948.1 hypothetical protein FDI85_gp253 [Erwinia phage Machina]ANZ49114.1 hypothetical protein HUXLEY_32 [Erwinia phage vB_EamM_Huxley]ANZ49669.1 hypothetical protein MACHINA_31 [Erwinia phage Machina]
MVYKVVAYHTWSMHLGVVEYLTGSEAFSELVTRTVESFPKMKIALPVGPLEEDAIFAALHNTMPSYLQAFMLTMTRAEESHVKSFLKSLDKEYRRWKFGTEMDSGSVDGVLEDLVPLIKLYKANNAEGATVTKTLLDYSVETLAQFFAGAIVEEFREAVDMFLTCHCGKVQSLSVVLNFPQCQYNLMDMRLLIDVSEE